jgi:F1F0 ATPase subunit 2
MTTDGPWPEAALLLWAAAGGMAAGAVYFALLWVSVRAFAGGGGWGAFAAGALLRALLLLAALYALFAAGAHAAVIGAAALGFLAARLIATRFGRPGED